MSYYGNINIPGTHAMCEDEEEMNIYANAHAHDATTEKENSDTKRHQTPRHTGSSRAAVVCLVLLCVLLLTAVIVLCVHIHTKNTNETKLTEERDQLLTTIKDFTAENKELLFKNDSLRKQIDDLQKRLGEMDKSCLYYFSSERKSWTESRKYCMERRADLITINNKEKQELFRNLFGYNRVWIGLTDSDLEGRWKWVDGSTLTSGFWGYGEPSGYRRENCAVTFVGHWGDRPCTEENNWICEKKRM